MRVSRRVRLLVLLSISQDNNGGTYLYMRVTVGVAGQCYNAWKLSRTTSVGVTRVVRDVASWALGPSYVICSTYIP